MRLLLAIGILLLSVSVIADDEFEDFDSDFDSSFEAGNSEAGKEKNTRLYGSAVFETHYNYQQKNTTKNISSAKALLDLIGEHRVDGSTKIKANLKAYHDLVYSFGIGNYTNTPSGYENELSLNEFYVEGSISDKVDYRIGRQVVVWGNSDMHRINDILNPLDLRTPGMVDIRNLRLGKNMSKLDYYHDNLSFSLIAIHEKRFSKLPAQYSDFRPTLADLEVEKLSSKIKNTGVAFSFFGAFEGYDIALYFADTYVDKPHLQGGKLHYDTKSKMVGAAYSKALNNYLFKAEAAYFDKIKYTGVSETKAKTDLMFGFEYSGNDDSSIAYEATYQNINNYDQDIYSASNQYKKNNEIKQSVGINKSYQNQTINVSLIASIIGHSTQEGGSARAQADYAINDNIKISGGIIDYIGGSNPSLESLKNNDRAFIKATYSF
jgi:hypothetical protein